MHAWTMRAFSSQSMPSTKDQHISHVTCLVLESCILAVLLTSLLRVSAKHIVINVLRLHSTSNL